MSEKAEILKLVDEIAEIRRKVAKLERELELLQKKHDLIESKYLLDIGTAREDGKLKYPNESLRRAALRLKMNEDGAANELEERIRKLTEEIENLNIEVERLEDRRDNLYGIEFPE